MATSKHWFHGMTKAAQKAYIAAHPRSQFAGKRARTAIIKQDVDQKRAARKTTRKLDQIKDKKQLVRQAAAFEKDMKHSQKMKEAIAAMTPAERRAYKATVKKGVVAKRAKENAKLAAEAKRNKFKNTSTVGGVKLIGKKSAASSGMGAAPKAEKRFKNTSTTGGVKMLAHKGAASSGMGGKAKAAKKFTNTSTTGGVKLLAKKSAAHMGTKITKGTTRFKNTNTQGGVKLIGSKRAAHMG